VCDYGKDIESVFVFQGQTPEPAVVG